MIIRGLLFSSEDMDHMIYIVWVLPGKSNPIGESSVKTNIGMNNVKE